MGKSTHFIGQPMYNQALKLLDKSKILRISREKGGERYTKRFNGWTHLVVMLYAVIKRFDSLREITTSLLADTNKLAHIGILFKISRSTLADANMRRPHAIFEAIYRDLYARYRHELISDSRSRKHPKWMDRLQIIDSTTISLFSNLIFKGVGRHPKTGKKKGGIKVHTVIYEIIAIYRQRWEIELLFKQIKQNFPLKYFYGESANAIKIQIWVTLIANLLLMVMQKRLTRSWSFSGLASLVGIVLMYYVDFYSLFNNPEKDWENMKILDKNPPPQLTLFV